MAAIQSFYLNNFSDGKNILLSYTYIFLIIVYIILYLSDASTRGFALEKWIIAKSVK